MKGYPHWPARVSGVLMSCFWIVTFDVWFVPSCSRLICRRMVKKSHRKSFLFSSSGHMRRTFLIDLHWLPVAERIKFKIILLTFKALHGLSPV
jgi:hypothetical protein